MTLFDDQAACYYSIDSGRPFLADLSQALMSEFNNDPFALSACVILLPTRRAARELGECFRQLSSENGNAATMLPRIKPIGDVNEEEFLTGLFSPQDEIDLAPAVSPLERKVIFAKWIARKEKKFAGVDSWAAALNAAAELTKLIDSFYTEEISFSTLDDIALNEFAEHWGSSLAFLKIVTDGWPAFLKSINKMDPTERHIQLVSRQVERWQQAPPEHPVILAGSTGSVPAVGRLIKTVAMLPKGLSILPGIDRDLAGEHGWDKIDDAHPQAGLKVLIQRLEISPCDIKPWPNSGKASHPRARVLSTALRPAAVTDDWRDLVAEIEADDPKLKSSTAGLTLIEADDEEAEAGAIALVMREALERPGQTIMLVTPDRDLSRRVSSKLLRWDVILDDSAGMPFHNSSCGTFLRLVANWLTDQNSMASLVALTKHPLSGFGLALQEKFAPIEAIDHLVRGLKPSNGLAEVRRRIEYSRDKNKAIQATCLLESLEAAANAWPKSPGGSFSELLNGHLVAAEALARTNDKSGATRLWAEEDGGVGAGLIANVQDVAYAIDQCGNDYPVIFSQLISGSTVRRWTPAHPRLSILGPLEARLQSADITILGGLNEGVWPAESATDPFLSRAMRHGLDLPSPERRIGLSAHDFAQLAAYPKVVLTRSKRAESKPSKPSRWILRLKNLLTGADALDKVDVSQTYAGLLRNLDVPQEICGAKPPRFCPPTEARPDTLFVTKIEKLLRDPYSIYASQILKLRKLNTLDEIFDARHRGNLFHKIFETFASDYGSQMPDDPQSILENLLENLGEIYGYNEVERAFSGAQAKNVLLWFETYHETLLQSGRPIILEEEGEATLDIDGRSFTLKAKADRIDLRNDGSCDIIDYKSGDPPTMDQMRAKFNPQLALTALICEKNGFEGLENSTTNKVEYVRFYGLKKNANPIHSIAKGDEARSLIDSTHEALIELIRFYNRSDTPYCSQPRPQFTDAFGDFDLLARRPEWVDNEDTS